MPPESQRLAKSFSEGRAIDEMPSDPAPPYQVEMRDILAAEAVFDPDAIRAALPPELEPSDRGTGTVLLYSTPTGWGLAPSTSFTIRLHVNGHDSPDGSQAVFVVQGFHSGPAGVIIPRDYSTRNEAGYSRQWQDGDIFWGEAGSEEHSMVRLALKVDSRPDHSVVRSGITQHLGQRATGGLNVYNWAFTGRDYPAKLLAYDLLPGATDLLRSLVPLRWTRALLNPHMAGTLGAPRPLIGSEARVAADATQLSLMHILTRIGHAAALVTPDGRVLFINSLARQMLSGALTGGRLTGWRRQDRTQLGSTLSTLQPGRLSHPVALRRPDGAVPLLARALPVSVAMAGEPAALVLFSDPTAPTPGAETTLVLLGLTPAEARIAAQVGRGLTLREAAQVVGVTESTARSTLKAVYGKLMIGKQSELALVVARLEGFA